MLCIGQRSYGLLQKICDQLRNGQQMEEDLRMLMLQNGNFPEFRPHYTLHYDNKSCIATNWRQLWSESQSTDPPKQWYIFQAAYYMTGNNHQTVDGLATLLASG